MSISPGCGQCRIFQANKAWLLSSDHVSNSSFYHSSQPKKTPAGGKDAKEKGKPRSAPGAIGLRDGGEELAEVHCKRASHTEAQSRQTG